jgi:hypothetical protein
VLGCVIRWRWWKGSFGLWEGVSDMAWIIGERVVKEYSEVQ